jgi:hypothetical protein
MKASDVYHETEHSFGSKVPFEKAFPQIEQISIEIIETERAEHIDFNAFDKIKHRQIYTKDSLPGKFIDCRNPECHKGGLSIGGILRKMIPEKLTELQETKNCLGYESLPEGRKKHKHCCHRFHYKVEIKYMENVKTT